MQQVQFSTHQGVEMYEFGYAPIGKPLLTVYCYYLDGLLIDTAQANAQRTVLRTLAEKPLQQIALTHWHEDHTGNVAALQAQHQPTIYAHPFTQQKVQQGFRVLPYERFLFGKIKPTNAAMQSFPAAIETDRYTLTPIATPGHSSDHHVFLEKQQGWLFSGDLYVGVKIKYFRKGEDIGQQIASLEKVLQYDFDVLFCGHTPQRKGAKDCLRAKLHYFQDFYGTVLTYWQKGYPPKQIIRQMKRKEIYWLKLLTFNDVSLQHMITSVIESEQRKKKA